MLRTSKGIGKPSRPRVYDICETSKYAASSLPGMYIRSPRWPLLGSAPGTVVNGQRFRLAGGGTYGTEYKGVGGVWVAQASVTMGLWKSKKVGIFTQDSYIRSAVRLFDLNTDFDMEFVIKDTWINSWEMLVADRITFELMKTLAFVRGSDTDNINTDVYGADLHTWINALAFAKSYAKYRIVRIGAFWSMYINGVLFDSATFSTTVDSNGTHVNLGSTNGFNGGFDGVFSSFKVTSPLGSINWDMEDITGSSVPDRSGNGNDGTVANVTTEFAWVPVLN